MHIKHDKGNLNPRLRDTLLFVCSLVAETRLDIGHTTQKLKTEIFGSFSGEV